ncbi:hypothetical protein D3C78_741850 [compost metagenome]
MLGAPGRRARQVAAIFNNGVKHLTIMRSDILHVAHVFVAPFNFEGAHASVDERRQVCRLIVVFHRQQMFFERHDAALIVFQGIRQTTRLRAVTTVGAAPGLRVGNIALAGIGHTQRTVDEEFNVGVSRLVDIADLIQIQLARQHDLGKTYIRKKLRFFNGANIALGTGVQFNRRNIQLKHAHILNDQRVDARLIQIGNQALGGFQFIIMKNGVQGHEHFCTKTVGKRHQLRNILQAIAGVMASAKARAADIDRVRTVKNRFTGDGGVASRA